MPDHRNVDTKANDTTKTPKTDMSTASNSHGVLRDAARQLDPVILNNLHVAALSADRTACTHALNRALDTGITREDMADFYIPELSRVMGDQWCSDELGFAGVTIGVSRLQSMLRDLGPDWNGDKSANPNAPAIMLVVPQDVYHTLGAMVLAGQLRRQGLSVRMMLGVRPEELTDRMDHTHYDAVFISSSRGETLESLRRIVDVIKSATHQPPIVIGGTLLEVETKEDVTALTGADYATSRPDEAIRLCGLKDRLHKTAPKMRRT